MMSPESFRTLVENLLLCGLVGIGTSGVIFVFMLQWASSRREEYYRGMCYFFNDFRELYENLKSSSDKDKLACVRDVLVALQGSPLEHFFDDAETRTMQEYIYANPRRFEVLACTMEQVWAAKRKHSLEVPRTFSTHASTLYGLQRFEGIAAKMTRLFWPAWCLGLIAVSVLVTLLWGFESMWLQSETVRSLLLYVAAGAVAAEFTVATISIGCWLKRTRA